ncbi:hypothetical protein [Mycobacterium sp. Marseille-P9652]|uniref:hypothetical protein n=1 Tax=Mycobacterium sp. Marseille-P9652 TaxID=2654950 RepID=UPI0012E854C9|nr:hypothetical protein [Mycobacterium sp. Marseille-P9652]
MLGLVMSGLAGESILDEQPVAAAANTAKSAAATAATNRVQYLLFAFIAGAFRWAGDLRS